VTIQMKAIALYFHVVLFIMLYEVILAFSVWLDLEWPNMSYWAVLLHGTAELCCSVFVIHSCEWKVY